MFYISITSRKQPKFTCVANNVRVLERLYVCILLYSTHCYLVCSAPQFVCIPALSVVVSLFSTTVPCYVGLKSMYNLNRANTILKVASLSCLFSGVII